MVINAFPISSSSTPASKLINEYNLTNILKSLSSNDSFIVSYDNSNGDIKFVIHGYYFECDTATLNTNNYAQIIMNSDDSAPWININLSDSLEDNTTGLHLSKTKPTSGYYLQLFDNNSSDPSSRVVHEDSLIKFTTNSSTRSISIDDGDLDN